MCGGGQYLQWKMHISMFIIVLIETSHTSPVTFLTNYIFDHMYPCGYGDPPPPPKKKNYRQYTLIKQKGSIKTMDARQEFFKRGGDKLLGSPQKSVKGPGVPIIFLQKLQNACYNGVGWGVVWYQHIYFSRDHHIYKGGPSKSIRREVFRSITIT